MKTLIRIATALEGIWQELQKFNTPSPTLTISSSPIPKMRRAYGWTQEMDNILIEMRAKGKTYFQIARKLHKSPSSCSERASRIRKNGKHVD